MYLRHAKKESTNHNIRAHSIEVNRKKKECNNTFSLLSLSFVSCVRFFFIAVIKTNATKWRIVSHCANSLACSFSRLHTAVSQKTVHISQNNACRNFFSRSVFFVEPRKFSFSRFLDAVLFCMCVAFYQSSPSSNVLCFR